MSKTATTENTLIKGTEKQNQQQDCTDADIEAIEAIEYGENIFYFHDSFLTPSKKVDKNSQTHASWRLRSSLVKIEQMKGYVSSWAANYEFKNGLINTEVAAHNNTVERRNNAPFSLRNDLIYNDNESVDFVGSGDDCITVVAVFTRSSKHNSLNP
ncbi:hypothetical protein HK100_006073 [Physocladia obscura]|uniref:Uncharacterized protein n=1 Tax=Physocladia obscura TaxID=109957 RepID=A0AAD5T685_9FUNG|nr:hypothetical protein HK100_006073 [Physocladia obscura]